MFITSYIKYLFTPWTFYSVLDVAYLSFVPISRLLSCLVVALLYVFSLLQEVVNGLCCGSAICLFSYRRLLLGCGSAICLPPTGGCYWVVLWFCYMSFLSYRRLLLGCVVALLDDFSPTGGCYWVML